MKTSDLTGAALDYAVAKAQGWVDYPEDSIERGSKWHCDPEKAPFGQVMWKSNFQPSTNWAQGGPIIEREKISLASPSPIHQHWAAMTWLNQAKEDGPTPLIAAMRAFVASKLGDEVDVPEELAALVKGE